MPTLTDDSQTLSKGYQVCTTVSQVSNMCYQIVERYAVCKCLYHKHAIDPCQNYGRPGHSATEKTVLVGFACPDHGKSKATVSTTSAAHGSRHSNDSEHASGRGRG